LWLRFSSRSLGTHSSTNPRRLCPSRRDWAAVVTQSEDGISRFLLSLPELSSQDLNRVRLVPWPGHRDVQRRHRAPAGQDRRRRACPRLGRGRQRAEELRQRSVAGGARDVAGPDRGPASRCRSIRAEPNTPPSGKPRRRWGSGASISTLRATRCRPRWTQAWCDATQSQVTAAEVALNGVREEARVGQRTTLDVLNSQQDLVNARVALVTAQPGGGVLHGAGGDRRAVVASPRAQ